LKTRKLLILRPGKTAKTRENAEARYTAGTRGAGEFEAPKTVGT
jgi:hypothetical protein